MDVYFEAKRELFQPERSRRGRRHDRLRLGPPPRGRVADPRDHALARTPTSTPTGGSRCSRRPRPTRRSCSRARADAASRRSCRCSAGTWPRTRRSRSSCSWSRATTSSRSRTCSSATAASTPTSPGRAERISGDRGPLVYIDYGHSPDAFLQTLGADPPVHDRQADHAVRRRRRPRHHETRRDGRDRGARGRRRRDHRLPPALGGPGGHPRRADRRGAASGARAARSTRSPDPRAAFRAALSLAGEGDAILYAGPGHEDYHEVKGVKIPYSARDDAKQALREAGWGA